MVLGGIAQPRLELNGSVTNQQWFPDNKHPFEAAVQGSIEVYSIKGYHLQIIFLRLSLLKGSYDRHKN